MSIAAGMRSAPAVRRPTHTFLFVAACLLGFVALGVLALITRPLATASVAWWPAAGVALGMATRIRLRYTWILALAVTVLTVPIALGNGNTLPHSVALGIAVGIELAVGAVLMRRPDDRLPSLAVPSDIRRLILAIVASAAVFTLLATASDLIFATPDIAWQRFATSFSRHAAGMLLVAPLFMRMPKRAPRASTVEAVIQFVVSIGLAIFVFVANSSLPLAFLPFVPLVWAAMRMSTRVLLAQTLTISIIATVGSAINAGPFAFDRLGAAAGSVVLQVFQLSMLLVFLLLSLANGRESDTREKLVASEDLFRRNFNTSIAGMLIVTHGSTGWRVLESNDSAQGMLPTLADGTIDLGTLFGSHSQAQLTDTVDQLTDETAPLTIKSDDGRSFEVSVWAMDSDEDESKIALQLFDITETLRARERERQELERAGEVHRALSPGQLVAPPGWSFAALSAPATQVGGDFYDLRHAGDRAVVSLGDVMGKGVGAGMLAAATRATVRAADVTMAPAEAMARNARLLDWDLMRSGSFVTMAYAAVELSTGEVRLVDAGHGLTFAVRDDGASVERLASSNLPLGLDTAWSETVTTLAPRDTLLMLSDGVLDAWGGDIGDMADIITTCARASEGDAQQLVRLLGVGRTNVANVDDITAVAFRRKERAEPS